MGLWGFEGIEFHSCRVARVIGDRSVSVNVIDSAQSPSAMPRKPIAERSVRSRNSFAAITLPFFRPIGTRTWSGIRETGVENLKGCLVFDRVAASNRRIGGNPYGTGAAGLLAATTEQDDQPALAHYASLEMNAQTRRILSQ